MERTGSCSHCGDCCKTMRITAVLSHALKQHRNMEELKLYYQYHNVRVIDVNTDNDYLFLELAMPCNQLDNKNHCRVHNKPELKPILCHLYPTELESSNCTYQFKKSF
ncbi:MAG: YkgJ family cysteine cluster protein [Spirochaetota bacterium]|nr:YkgJ family cysteine cluster protein [Spirochaetota bacterium]